MKKSEKEYILYKYTGLKGSGTGPFIFKRYFCEELSSSINNSVLFRKKKVKLFI